MQISYQPLLGGAPQLKAKIQCEVSAALEQMAPAAAQAIQDVAKLSRQVQGAQDEVARLAALADAQLSTASNDDLLDRLQRAIDEAEHKPGQWAKAITAMGAICTNDPQASFGVL